MKAILTLPPQSWRAPPTLKSLWLASGLAQATTHPPTTMATKPAMRKKLQKVLYTEKTNTREISGNEIKSFIAENHTNRWQSCVHTPLFVNHAAPPTIAPDHWQETGRGGRPGRASAAAVLLKGKRATYDAVFCVCQNLHINLQNGSSYRSRGPTESIQWRRPCRSSARTAPRGRSSRFLQPEPSENPKMWSEMFSFLTFSSDKYGEYASVVQPN